MSNPIVSEPICLFVKSNLHFDLFSKFIEESIVDWSHTLNNFNGDEKILNIDVRFVFGLFGVLNIEIEMENEIISVSIVKNRDSVPQAELTFGEGFAVIIPDVPVGRELMQVLQHRCVDTKEYSYNIILDSDYKEIVF